MSDKITVLSHTSRVLAKVWQRDGGTKSYDHAKNFTVSDHTVNHIRDLSALLLKLEGNKYACVIRGSYNGDNKTEVRRKKENFDDRPLHSVLIEVDDYIPLAADPVNDPLEAIEEYIACHLPECFQGVTFHWQLSNSAGREDKKHLLKVHLWFWLGTPLSSAQLKTWALNHNIQCDKAVFNPIQIHYTSAPIFAAGVIDPVPKRSGLYVGKADSVKLEIESVKALTTSQDQLTLISRPSDPVLDRLDIIRWDPDGKAHIACPFEAYHSCGTAGDSSTTYFPANTNGFNRGHFKCLHNSCVDKKDRDFMIALGLSEDQLILDPADHTSIAKQLIRHRFLSSEKIQTLWRMGGSWYEYRDTVYRETTEEDVRADVRRFLDGASKITKDGEIKPFYPNMPQIASVTDALRTFTLQRNGQQPRWLNGNETRNPKDFVSMENGLLHIPSRTLEAHTADFFTLNTLPYSYVESGEPDEWLRFLRKIWPGDQESINALQEIFGYMLTADNSQHKMFMLKGPPRSGKGTITRILKQLLGNDNYVGPTLSSLAGDFGLQPLINKLVAVLPDARIGGHTNKHAVVEKLLMVSGDDDVTVGRKHQESWTGRIPARFIMCTNETPQLGDASGALASRFIVLEMKTSHLGSEDIHLGERLAKELPDILRWALEGRDRLRARGKFIQPKSAAQTIRELAHLNSPLLEFTECYCDIGPHYRVSKDQLYEAYLDYSRDYGQRYPSTKNVFARDLLSAIPTVTSARPGSATDRKHVFEGIRLNESYRKLMSGMSGV